MFRKVCIFLAAGFLIGATRPPLDPAAVTPIGNIAVSKATHDGRSALRVVDRGPPDGDIQKLVRIPGVAFGDGEIELWVSGAPTAGANPGARGFVGVMFRLSEDGTTGEGIYLRPTNGRADDQERRNHSVQYFSAPDWPWQRLRRETPSRYETYADLVPDRWTRMRIRVEGERAQLFLDRNVQPTLIVNGLKGGAGRKGGVALWIGPGTLAHFSGLRIDPRSRSPG